MTVAAFTVETRSDPRGERPDRFGWPGRMRRVAEVLDGWEGEGHRYFRLRADDGGIYILRHDLSLDNWQITFFQRGAATDLA